VSCFGFFLAAFSTGPLGHHIGVQAVLFRRLRFVRSTVAACRASLLRAAPRRHAKAAAAARQREADLKAKAETENRANYPTGPEGKLAQATTRAGRKTGRQRGRPTGTVTQPASRAAVEHVTGVSPAAQAAGVSARSPVQTTAGAPARARRPPRFGWVFSRRR
jgi:hypothetical protein